MMNLFWKCSGINLFSWLIKLLEIKEYAWLGIVKFDWDCTWVEFTVDNVKVLTFNWDCTLVKSEQLQTNWDFRWINLKIYNNNLLSYNL